MFFDDEFVVIDEDGEFGGIAELMDVTGDDIPDVAHIIQPDGTGLFVSLDETDFALQETVDDIDELQEIPEYDTGSLEEVALSDMTFGLLDNDEAFTETLFEEFSTEENLFENNAPVNSSNISFTGLTDNGLAFSTTYRSWLDGVDPDEVTTEDISTIAEHITDEFRQACPAVVQDPNSGFAMFPVENGILFYDVGSTVKDAKTYGADQIVGAVGHEIGHNITEKIFTENGFELTNIQHEMCADYLAGISLGLAGLSPEGLCEFLRDYNIETEDYPSSEIRMEIIQKGFDYANNPARQVLSPILFPNMDFMRNVLTENVLDVY